jgi:Cu(I)/Ag(I) efflux system membrane protein CusA/SilA
MINKIIDYSIENKFIVLLVSIAIIFAGFFAVKNINIDAIPDLSETQVIIRTDYAQQTPQIIEDQVTYPITTTMLGLPKTKVVRGFSMFGTSFVYIVFEQGTDLYWARSRVLEKLSQISNTLPEGVSPSLGVDATGVGWVYQYVLQDKTGKYDLADLRSMQDWFVKFELATVKGVAEVASVGGFVKEYQVQINPNKLRGFDLTLADVANAVAQVSVESGARTLEIAEAEYLIATKSYAKSKQDIANAVIKSNAGVPILVKDVADVIETAGFRRGIAEYNGEGEAVGGIVVMRDGNNALEVINRVKEKLKAIKQGLPEGVEIVPVYDRSNLINASIDNLKVKLIEESLIVLLVIFLFLMHVRSALVAIIVIPTGILASFIVMYYQGIQANIMSLGGIAIAIGAMVDASIVMVENAHKALANKKLDKQQEELEKAKAIKQVASGIFFSLLIITVSFIPVFALTGQSEKLFTPLAYTKTYAMAFAAVLSITLIPVLMMLLVKGKLKQEDSIVVNRITKKVYSPALNFALAKPKAVLLTAICLLTFSIYPTSKLGSEFMPALNEGSLLYMPMTLPAISADKMTDILQQTNQLIKQLPEVENVFAKAGRADTATDPAPLAMIETWINLKPMDQWRAGISIEDIKQQLDSKVKVPGFVNSWGYPIKIRLDMLSTGVRTALGIKIAGGDLTIIDKLAQDIESSLKQVDGIKSVIADRTQGANYINIIPKKRELARYGLSIEKFNKVVKMALSAMPLAQVVDGRERYNITMRYAREYRADLEDLENLLVDTNNNGYVALKQIADIKVEKGSAMIKSENARLNGWVFIDPAISDINGLMKDIEKHLADNIEMPEGYTISFAGSYEQMQETNKRLSIAIPFTILLVIWLLYLHFKDSKKVMIILASLPFAVLGAFVSLYIAGFNISVATTVGIIALLGLAIETAIIMLMYIDNQIKEHKPVTKQEFLQEVKNGALLRLRPKLMTALTVIIGLVPIFLQKGIGSDVMQTIALPMLGGMLSVMLTVLFIVPVIYVLCYNKNYE